MHPLGLGQWQLATALLPLLMTCSNRSHPLMCIRVPQNTERNTGVMLEALKTFPSSHTFNVVAKGVEVRCHLIVLLHSVRQRAKLTHSAAGRG